MIKSIHRVLAVAIMAALSSASGAYAADLSRAVEHTLANGLDIVVIPDHRAPVVTHVIAYRSGAAADPAGKSGIAHFVEHLMYKSTATIPAGAFARSISMLGGSENAVTSHDTTIYHQRVPKEGLTRVMEFEADRMVNLRFDDDEVRREREVIIEERRQRIDLSPINLLNEQMTGALLAGHPYRNPVLGWPEEMSRLSREDAAAFYRHHYAPCNAVVVVQGDVEPDEVLATARRIYGSIGKSGATSMMPRSVPVSQTGKRIERGDERVSSTSLVRLAFAAEATGSIHGRETLEVLMRILAQGDTSRLDERLVRQAKLSLAVEGGASPTRQGMRLALFAIAAPGAALDAIEAAMDEEIATLARNGISQDELDRARSVIAASDVYDSDKQLKSAMQVAEDLASGRTLEHIRRRPQRLAAVTRDDIRVAARHLAPDRMLTGVLRPGIAASVAGKEAAR